MALTINHNSNDIAVAGGGAPTIKRSSFMAFYPIGDRTFTHVGAFA